MKKFIESLSSPRLLVERLLAAASPSELLGNASPEEGGGLPFHIEVSGGRKRMERMG